MKIRAGGDLGDSIFTMCVLKALGGVHDLFLVDRPPVFIVERFPLLERLFSAQDYIRHFKCSEEVADVDLTTFRRWHSSTTPLVTANAVEFSFQTGTNLKVDGAEPWMKVEPDDAFENKIIVARSSRYNNHRFPWRQIVGHYGRRLLFVGLTEEHDNFCAAFGHVVHFRAKDFMEVGRAIAGAALFIGNQSSPHALALALGVNIISEVDSAQPDCIYPRQNVQYVCDGGCTLPDVDGSGTMTIPPVPEIPPSFNTSMVPPGMWQYAGLPPCSHFGIQRDLVRKMEGCVVEDAERRLLHFNVLRMPGFFNGTVNDPMGLFNAAYANAFPESEKVLSLTPESEYNPNTATK